MPAYKPHKCRCGKDIVFAKIDDANGKAIPVDMLTVGYEIIGDAKTGPIIKRKTGIVLNHFATCTQANDFTARNRAAAAAIGQIVRGVEVRSMGSVPVHKAITESELASLIEQAKIIAGKPKK